ENSTSIPIGKPISNTSVYILDNNMQIVPKGVPGELYIGGDGLARGYWNRPELTNEKFVANPFSSDPKERLYKTGDIVKCLADGNIEYVGRIDNQVKLRGYRIELGEIEETLKQHEVIKDAKVIIREDEPGDKRLVGYVISSEKLSNNVWIGYLKGKLPEYMVPSTLVYLETFPLTPNGKIDYSSLPMPQSTDYILDDYTPPSSLIEKSVAEIWKDVLRIENLGIHNNFFELGGHSLLATQVISRINKEMNINLPLRVLFEHNTIAKFAHYIETANHDYKKIDSHVEIKNISKEKEALPLSFSQQRLWFLDQLDSGNSAYNVPIVLQVNGTLNYKALKQAVSKIIARHEILRTSFKVIGEKAIQWIHPSKDMDIPILQFKNEEEIMQVIEQRIWEPFDLEKGPLFRAELICQAENQHILCMCIHHIIFDGWSRDIFLKELTELYEHYSKGKEHSLKKLPIQYADFSYWQ
ncbi:condensation domain-containing protein, partial [Bacillus thuringiensis]|uniref:condensation domain-containing protein n=1 Tax=Bacillus thuringiensis TaxID=1428 RepID=UPI003A870474